MEKRRLVAIREKESVSKAEGREAEKRNDDETRSHYYIHIQARWGKPSPSFHVLRPPLTSHSSHAYSPDFSPC